MARPNPNDRKANLPNKTPKKTPTPKRNADAASMMNKKPVPKPKPSRNADAASMMAKKAASDKKKLDEKRAQAEKKTPGKTGGKTPTPGGSKGTGYSEFWGKKPSTKLPLRSGPRRQADRKGGM